MYMPTSILILTPQKFYFKPERKNMSENCLSLEFTTKSSSKLEVTLLECTLSSDMQHELPSSTFISKDTFAIGTNVFDDVSIILPHCIEEKRFSTIQCWDYVSREIVIQKCLDRISELFGGKQPIQLANFSSKRNNLVRIYHWTDKVSAKEVCKEKPKSQLNLALRFSSMDNYLFVYIDKMQGNFTDLPICDNLKFSVTSPDRFWICEDLDSGKVNIVFPFNNEYMKRITVFDCKGGRTPQQLEDKIVNLISDQVFNRQGDQLCSDKSNIIPGWRSYEWVSIR